MARGERGELPSLGAPGAPQAGAGARAGRFSLKFSSRFANAVKTERGSSSRSVSGLRAAGGAPGTSEAPPLHPHGLCALRSSSSLHDQNMTFGAVLYF